MSTMLLVCLIDGSNINLLIPTTTTFPLSTAYGTLQVPVAAVLNCDMGEHVNDVADENRRRAFVAKLSHKDFSERDLASKWFAANPRGSYRYLKLVEKHMDLEVAKRAQALLANYSSVPPQTDYLGFRGGCCTGTLQGDYISGESAALGKVKLYFSQIKSFTVKMQKTVARINSGEEWQKVTTITSGNIKIKAAGQVDLWSQGPGQYVCGPNGYTTQVEGFPAGALLGRIGGRTFLVGENFSAMDFFGRGELELKVNGSNWQGSVPMGGYDATIE